MIKIRLQRHGARHAPSTAWWLLLRKHAVMAVLSRCWGLTNQARVRDAELNLKMDRVDHWLEVGAQPTETANSLIHKVVYLPKNGSNVRIKSQKQKLLVRLRKRILHLLLKPQGGSEGGRSRCTRVQRGSPSGGKSSRAGSKGRSSKEEVKEEEAAAPESKEEAPVEEKQPSRKQRKKLLRRK